MIDKWAKNRNMNKGRRGVQSGVCDIFYFPAFIHEEDSGDLAVG